MLDIAALLQQLEPSIDNFGPLPAVATGLFGRLPEIHRRILLRFNGFTVQRGTCRLFGVGRHDCLDLEWWNAETTWRFAWDDRVSPFLFFGATAWGDQYAYRIEPGGRLDPHVYFLEATTMRAYPLASSIQEFVETELLQVAHDPYDAMTIQALDRFGPIEVSSQWMLAPSLALGGEEVVENVLKMRSEDAMVIAGDIATALRGSRPGASPTAVDPWTDINGRDRIRVTFDIT